MKTYVDIAQEWGSEIDAAAANDDDEIEIFGATGNYYIYIKSWNNDVDEIEAEIYNKVTLPAEGEDGAKAGTPSFPASWTLVTNDPDDGLSSDIEILSIHAAGNSDYLFIKITTEAAVDLSDSTIGVIIDDVSVNSGTYEAACSSHRIDTTNHGFVYQWQFSAAWLDEAGTPADYDDHIVVNSGHNGVQLACDLDELGFAIDFENDKIRAVSTDADPNAFGDASFWRSENVPSTSIDDIVDATAIGIPEFSTLLMPIASVMLIVGNRIRNKDE